MTQKGTGRRRKAPAYSADTLALRLAGGLALAALGVMLFMSVALQMEGQIFDTMKRLCYGLCGALAPILPAIPLWAGVLVIWSTQRKAPVRPWGFASLAFLAVCAFVVLVTRTRTQEDYLTWLASGTRNSWGDMIHAAFEDCADPRHHYSGGALGVLLGWPLWRIMGTVLSAAVTFLLAAAAVLLAFRLTPGRIRALVSGRAGQRQAQQEQERRYNDERQMAWQQEQARQQQLAWEQQQAYLLEQQQMQQRQAAAQRTGGYVRQTAPVPVQSGQETGGVETWQAQIAAQHTAVQSGKGYTSRIFGPGTGGADAGEKPAQARKKLFGRKEAYDGLSDGSSLPQTAGAGTRRGAGVPGTGRPETNWSGSARTSERWKDQRNEPVPEREKPHRTADTDRAEAADAWRTAISPAEVPAGWDPGAQRAAEQTAPEKFRIPADRPDEEKPAGRTADGFGRKQAAERPEARTPAARQKSEETAGSDTAADWSRRLNDAMSRSGMQEKQEPEIPPEPAAKAVPAVTQVIGADTWKPDLKLPPKAPEEETEEIWEPVPYNYPPITDLAQPRGAQENTSEEDQMRSRRLEETLASFKVQARVVHVTHGPAISRFELELAAGTKVNKVAELEKDIAYGMEATSVRIEAPIPGKSLVGVEVPNRKVATVTLREVLESDKMQNARSLLTVALGRDIAGTPIVCDLAKMPHMLIAGQTGSGKSVCINAIINSLLYRASPDEVKMILVDPKVVELQCYNGIPHLLIPVVNDPHKAAAALAWAVAEMMERYDRFAERRVRNLEGYNSTLGPHEKPMSRIVIIIDELADLMMVCKKDVEEYICRLTQLARAAGIHLIVATQRPSVDVITGLIKANIPSRIAFKTASSVDSRTILDRNGSEQLLGWGDMLYLPTGAFSPVRVQGCFLSDEEVNRIVRHVREGNPSTYDPDILEKVEQLSGGAGSDVPGADMIGGAPDSAGSDVSLFNQAVEMAITDGQISTSTLQRRLKIGYARAGRLTDEMEERGIVAAKDGSKPRKCLITREEWDEIRKATEGAG